MSDPNDQTNANPFDGPSPVEPKPKMVVVDSDKDARTTAMLAHLSGILAGVLTGFLLGFLGPLIIWLVKKDSSSFVADQAKEALNFQITLVVAYLLAYAITIATCGFAIPILAVPFILQIVFGIIGAMKANEGEMYRYPFNIRIVT